MKGTIRATVKVGNIPQREKRFTVGTPKRVITAWKQHEREKLRKRYPVSSERAARRDRLQADAERYLGLVRHLADWVSRRSEIRAWFPELGERFRHTITREDILKIRGEWRASGVAAKTINNRVSALRDLFRKLDGDGLTPCDGIKPLASVKVPPQLIVASVVQDVMDRLERSHAKHAKQDRARLMVLATTGKRPVEVERAYPADVDLRRRVWLTRDAKGGYSPGCYLNEEMIAAWEAFIEAEAWGPFPDHFPRRLRDHGWPAGVRVYNLRHSTWIEASERGADLADIQAGAGHRNISTTRRHYVPVLASRMQRLSEMLDGRFGWKGRGVELQQPNGGE